ncbi:single-stranded DNA-binding protein WHY2, mitochondrial isoform X2 [Macadamia integrifolia]|uniref:single-stranded DNA-binding protein WHY2, mitochondrial isoform X2 n=1 Tax=Macadamia integrifolia TaxID=60698 RepID=UPI001C4F73DC|nr:single-stranded DNA-binding protein WHY2, mitochondrial isoform X2 [Macadamia integrifolia]
MMKLSQFVCRNAVSEKLFSGRACNVKDCTWLQNLPFRGIVTSSQELGEKSGKIFADYTVFKGKAAFSIRPSLPTFRKLDTGGSKIDRMGSMMLTFWPAIGQRKYDWEKKQVFALSPTEVGSVISLGLNDSCEFFHDPSMKTSLAGQVRKSLSVTPIADGGGYFFSLSVVNNNLKTNDRLSVPITSAEFAVIRTTCSFILPHLMGWNQYSRELTSSQKLSGYNNQLKNSQPSGYTSQLTRRPEEHIRTVVPLNLDSEWDK